MTNLSVNVNKIAWLRNARGGETPSIIELSKICIENGVQGITVHPRDDMRHINPSDVKSIKSLVSKFAVELNVEGNPFSGSKGNYPGFLEIVKQNNPDQCTLVPDKPDQLTSDHGWDLLKDTAQLEELIQDIKSFGSRVSLFIDPNLDQISRAKKIGADRIELYTGPYAKLVKQNKGLKELLNTYSLSAIHAHKIGLGVNAGHDLNLDNLEVFLEKCNIDEVSIGHALISDALKYGLESTITKYLNKCF